MSMTENVARRRVEAGQLALGMGVRQSRTADHALLSRTCGFDWIFLDLEHSSLSIQQTSDICSAALAAGITPFVRVSSHHHQDATRYLDTGAMGIIVPDVDLPEQAESIARNCRFPPRGKRSIPSAVPQVFFEPIPTGTMMELFNREVMVVAMLESPLAIENADAIAAVDGIDAIIIGGNDLTARYGVPGQFEAPQMRNAFETVITSAKRHGKIPGFAGVGDEKAQIRYIREGCLLVQCGTDIAFLQAAASAKVRLLRESAR